MIRHGGPKEMQEGRTSSIIGGTAVCWLAILLLLAASAAISSRILQERMLSAWKPMNESAGRGNLLAQISRRPSFAFGFRNFLADMAWLQAVQVAGTRKMVRGDYEQLYLLIDTVNNFDPKFPMPYLLGGLILGDSPDHTREALQVLSRGWKNLPSEWRFPFYIGYVRYFSLGDPVEAGKALLEAARIPGSAAYLPLLASRMLSEGRDPKTAVAFLMEMLNQEKNPDRRESLERRIREVIVERDLQILGRGVEEYRHRTGRLPENLDDLMAVGLIHEVPREPNGGRYFMTPAGEVRSDRVSERMKVFRKK
jgi:hypothetical protein